MAHKVGRSIKKEVLDDALGIDENKTFGIKNKTLVGGALAKVTPGAKNNIFGQAGDFIEDKVTAPVKEGVGALVGGVLGGGQDNTQATLDAYNAQVSALEAKENEANRMALANTLLSRGKGKFFDVTRPEEVEKFLIEQEGKYLDPFPDYLRQSGDRLLGDLENTAENINNYIGTANERMENFQPTLDRLGSINQNAIDKLASIYDGRMESELGGYKDRAQDITRQLQALNTEAGDVTSGLQQGVLDRAESYANALGRSVDMEAQLANEQYDQLQRIPDIIRDQNRELDSRFSDTMQSELDAASGSLGAEYGAAQKMFGAENRAADMIQRAERAKALAAGANAENMANAQQRGINSAMVGQGGGTAQNMGNAMIRAQLGQDRSDMLADALIRDAERRGQAGIGFADRTGQADIGYAGSAGDAGIGYSSKLEDILDSDAELADAKLAGQRFETLRDINPAMADVYRDEAMLGRANTALGFGDPRLQSRAENLGLDQSMVDSDQAFFSSMLSQQLANTGMIPGLGMQEAMLPALMGEAALSGQGPLARSVSPYTSTGTLPQGQTVFQNTPYIPPSEGQRRDWLDILSDIPSYINKGQEAYGKIQGIFN